MANGNDKSADGSSPLSLVTVAAAAASGIGVLGFVTLAGGVVLWKRFVEMGLPADQAVAVVPTPVLVATGAEFLLPAVVLTAVPALALMLIKIKTPASASEGPLDGAAIPRPSGLITAFSRLLKLIHLSPVWEVERADRAMSYWWAVRIGVTVVLIEVGVAVWIWHEIGLAAVLILAAIAVAGGLVVGVAVRFIKSGAAVALIAFLAIGTFWVARAYEKTSHALTVIPMAYARTEAGYPARVEIGYFVAETSDRIWFASLPHPGLGHPFNELREFPRTETEDLEVGTLVRAAQAQANATLFLANLCQRLISEEATAIVQKQRGRLGAHHQGPARPNGCPRKY